ncbi:MAG: tRNA pseudouridine(13) synthase TruD [Planctomycetaceae bacterium]
MNVEAGQRGTPPDYLKQIAPEVLQSILSPATIHQPVIDQAIIKSRLSDFIVEELPAYEPCGDGEHLFLWVEKRGLSGPDLIERIARRLQIRSADIGIAGQKDRHAVTRQFVSVHRNCEPRLSQLESDDLTILSVTAHQNKLRTGHLKGNRFSIVLRSENKPFEQNSVERLQNALASISNRGFASTFGTQRFGFDGETLKTGLCFLRGQFSKKRWPYHQQRFMSRFVVSAVQSAAYNLVLHDRILNQQIESPVSGDIVIRKQGSRPFEFNMDMPTEPGQVTADETRLIPAGPMFGNRMLAAKASARAYELRALECLGIQESMFTRQAKFCPGTRRIAIEFPENVQVHSVEGGHVRLEFELRSGVYATTLLRELIHICTDTRGINEGHQSLGEDD